MTSVPFVPSGDVGWAVLSPGVFIRGCLTQFTATTPKQHPWGEPVQPRAHLEQGWAWALAGHFRALRRWLSNSRWKGNILNPFPRIKAKTHQNKSVLWLCSCQPNLGGAEWDFIRRPWNYHFWGIFLTSLQSHLPQPQRPQCCAWTSVLGIWAITAQHKLLLSLVFSLERKAENQHFPRYILHLSHLYFILFGIRQAHGISVCHKGVVSPLYFITTPLFSSTEQSAVSEMFWYNHLCFI